VLFSPGDIVQNKMTREVYAIRGWASTQNKVIIIDGEYIYIGRIIKVRKNSGLIIN